MLGHNVLFCPDGFNSGEFVTHDVNFVNCDLRAYAFSRMRKEESKKEKMERKREVRAKRKKNEKARRKRERGRKEKENEKET